MPGENKEGAKFIAKGSSGAPEEEKKLNMGLVIAFSVFLITVGALVYLYAGLKKATKKPTFPLKRQAITKTPPTRTPETEKTPEPIGEQEPTQEPKEVYETKDGMTVYKNLEFGFELRYYPEWGELTSEKTEEKTTFALTNAEITFTIEPTYDPEERAKSLIDGGCAYYDNEDYHYPAFSVSCDKGQNSSEHLYIQKRESTYALECYFDATDPEENVNTVMDQFFVI